MRMSFGLILALAAPGVVAAQDTSELLAKIKAVGKEGAGSVAARQAWAELVRRGPDVLVATLAGLNDASPRAANWVRSAVDAIAENALADGKTLPAAKLEEFVKDHRHSGAARRLAYEWLVKVDAKAPGRLLPGMLDDPGAELRRDAVALVLNDAGAAFEKNKQADAEAGYKRALKFARDRDQLKLIADRLKKLGHDVDLAEHFGFVTRWCVIGPFDSSGGKGFKAVYPPEKGVNLMAVYEGKEGKVRWFDHVAPTPAGSTDLERLGLVDFNKIIGPLHGTVAYAYAAIDTKAERDVELRAGSFNAVRIYLNGKEIYFREEYHHGMQMDMHVGRGKLKAGRNEILVKVCQNEQTESWAQNWSVQLRVCDAIGGAVPVTTVTEKVAPKSR
jgi:hypothetical protein